MTIVNVALAENIGDTSGFGACRIYPLHPSSNNHGHSQFYYIHAKYLWTEAHQDVIPAYRGQNVEILKDKNKYRFF